MNERKLEKDLCDNFVMGKTELKLAREHSYVCLDTVTKAYSDCMLCGGGISGCLREEKENKKYK